MDNANFYYDPNAFLHRYNQTTKQKVDLNHIERVVYPEPYENMSNRYNKDSFAPKQEDPKQTQNNSGFGGRFDFSKLLPLLTSGGNLNNLLPQLLGNLGLNQDILSLFKNFNTVKKVESKVVENFEKDTISKYERVKK